MNQILAAALIALAAAPAAADTLHVGPGARYTEPSEAIRAADAGDTIDIAPGQYFDCAIIKTPHLTIQGVGDPTTVVMTDKACNGKALLIVNGADTTVRNLTLTRVRVPDGNGAGIRMQAGNLTVDGVHFVNDQEGILTAPNPSWVLTVENSVFDKDGACQNACAHGIYAGNIAKLIVRNTRFTETRHAHHIKSRALYTEVTGCTITDGPDGTASYEIEVPNGGTLIARNNTIEKGPQAENHSAAIVIGDEAVSQPTGEITVENNTFTNDNEHRTAFVNNGTATEAHLHGNHLKGAVDPLKGDGTSN